MFVALATGKADEFKLHAPGRQEIHPGLSGARSLGAHGGLAENPQPLRTQVFQGCIEVIHIEGQVVPAKITVARQRLDLAIDFVLEDFKVAAVFASQQPQVPDFSSCIHVQVSQHPVAVGILDTAEGINQLATDHVHEKSRGRLDIRHGEAYVIGTPEPGDASLFRFETDWLCWIFAHGIQR